MNIFGTSDNDFLFVDFNQQIDSLYSGTGDDFIIAQGYIDYIYTGKGNDTIVTNYDHLSHSIYGGRGNDHLEIFTHDEKVKFISNDVLIIGDKILTFHSIEEISFL